MIATVTNFDNLSSGLPSVSRRLVLRRDGSATKYGGMIARFASRFWHRIAGGFAAMSGEALTIWSMSAVATLGFVVLVFGGGTL